ncbi:flavin-containing monooxygenase [Paractinoplanes atraurantiacus]|uniref:Putative flavoprotein involved in K+ transport n=1 Tax=Paractinoplanes atraurantiacus TaxID=1036182 RepID=A0A285GLP1_9ACTN|nr:NAD(P)/FAD-dependent oxidoreductase [Actinoplanes atraurantiacus]SNY24489.1 putative flavoprotein involved in K+ transport [Actinoplanes atraurantiacus]
MVERADVVVVGGGQSGLVAGHYLAQAGIPHVILDAGERVGESWRQRWDALRLFTVAQYCALPGLRFPGRQGRFPTKDEMADYVEEYARHWRLPVRLNTKVTSLSATDDGYRLETSTGPYEARQVIVATGAYREPYVPPLAAGLDEGVFQVHTGRYHNPSQVPGSSVLVVGAANSGAQIATDLSRTHRVTLSQGSPLPHVPCKFLFKGLHWWGDKFGLIKKPLIGERDRLHKKTILIGKSLKQLARKHDLRLVGRTVAMDGRVARFEDGGQDEPDAVVWATGFRASYPWIKVPILDEAGMPRQDRGVSAAPGLYFLGMQCQYTYGSALIWWVKEDAHYLVEQIRAVRSGSRSAGQLA